MSERVYAATVLTPSADVRADVSHVSYQPTYPANGSPLDQVLWIAGQLQLVLDIRVDVVRTGDDQFFVQLVRGEYDFIRYHGFDGGFTLAQLRAYLWGLVDGFKYAVRQPLT